MNDQAVQGGLKIKRAKYREVSLVGKVRVDKDQISAELLYGSVGQEDPWRAEVTTNSRLLSDKVCCSFLLEKLVNSVHFLFVVLAAHFLHVQGDEMGIEWIDFLQEKTRSRKFLHPGWLDRRPAHLGKLVDPRIDEHVELECKMGELNRTACSASSELNCNYRFEKGSHIGRGQEDSNVRRRVVGRRRRRIVAIQFATVFRHSLLTDTVKSGVSVYWEFWLFVSNQVSTSSQQFSAIWTNELSS